MSALARSEALKVLTVRTFLWLALANAALVFAAALSVAVSQSLVSAEDDRSAAQTASAAIILALIGGILVMAGEVTHGTITQTLLVTPLRERVFLAKVAVAAGVGFALAVLAEVLTIIIAGVDLHNARGVLLGILIAAPLAGALGVGVGAIFQGQGTAIAVCLVWLLVGETFAALLRGDTEKYTPGRSFGSLVSGVLEQQEGMLGMVGGGVAAALWTVLFLVAGVLALKGRDI